MKVQVLVAPSCLTLCDPVECSPPGSSVHGILQARILKWVAIPFARGSSWPRDQAQGLLHCRQMLYHLSHRGSPSFSICVYTMALTDAEVIQITGNVSAYLGIYVHFQIVCYPCHSLLSLPFPLTSEKTHQEVSNSLLTSGLTLILWPYFIPDTFEKFIRMWSAQWWISNGVYHSFATHWLIHGPVQPSPLNIYIHLYQRRSHHR